MIYFSQMLGIPVLDAHGARVGKVNDLGIATREVFPRITALAFEGPGKTPFMISWRKYVAKFDESAVHLSVPSADIRFSYLQPDEMLIARDLMNKQIVDTRGMKVVRVNDLKLSNSGADQLQLRLIGAEVGPRGRLRAISPAAERAFLALNGLVGKEVPEEVIAWNYMELLDRNTSDVKLSVSHSLLDELHPADVADILEQLDPRLRGEVFAQLDDAVAAETMAELDNDELAAEIVGDMDAPRAARVMNEMDPDDAAELVAELGQDKAERLLHLMGVKEERAVRQLLGYREHTAGRIMTSEFVACPETATVAEARETIRKLDDDFESVHYVYTLDEFGKLSGALNLRKLIASDPETKLGDIATRDLVTTHPNADQEEVAEAIAKYNLSAIPVVDDNGIPLGIVTVDDALEVLKEEHEEDLRVAGSQVTSAEDEDEHLLKRLFYRELWFFFWMGGILLNWLIYAFLLPSATGRPADDFLGLVASMGMPVALLGCSSMVRFVTDYYLSHNETTTDGMTPGAFTFRATAAGIVYAALTIAFSMLMFQVVGDHPIVQGSRELGQAYANYLLPPGLDSFVIAALLAVLSFGMGRVCLHVMYKRAAAGKETSGLALKSCALACTVLAFTLVMAMRLT